jgi:hypothetical protein
MRVHREAVSRTNKHFHLVLQHSVFVFHSLNLALQLLHILDVRFASLGTHISTVCAQMV